MPAPRRRREGGAKAGSGRRGPARPDRGGEEGTEGRKGREWARASAALGKGTRRRPLRARALTGAPRRSLGPGRTGGWRPGGGDRRQGSFKEDGKIRGLRRQRCTRTVLSEKTQKTPDLLCHPYFRGQVKIDHRTQQEDELQKPLRMTNSVKPGFFWRPRSGRADPQHYR